MTQDEMKQAVAKAALDYVEENAVLGVGTGSTMRYFIEFLADSPLKKLIKGTVASSIDTETRLKKAGLPVLEFNEVDQIDLYIDGADACNKHRQLIKGGGGALTREKILATASKLFICIVDETKKVDILGEFPVPIEVLPMARSYVAREIIKLNGNPEYRQGLTTDNGNIILDVRNWVIEEPLKLEHILNNIPGVVCNGIFAERAADLLLIRNQGGMTVLGAPQFLMNNLINR